MKAAGHDTHIIGKWHLGHYCPQCLPTNRGFDSFYGFLTGAEDYETKSFCINIENDGPEKCGYDFYKNTDRNPSANGTYSTYQFRDAAKAVIEKSHSDYITTGVKESAHKYKNKKSWKNVLHISKRPFFIYLPMQSVHGPLNVPKNYSDLYPDVKDHNRKTYLGMVSAMDEAIGGIVDTLRNVGELENTIIFFTSDNGGFTNAGGRNRPYRGQKRTIWEGGIHVPAFITGPGIRKKNAFDGLFHIVDVQPTILDMAGIDLEQVPSKPLDGISQWNNFKVDNPATRNERKEILVNIDYDYIRAYSPDPDSYKPYPNPYFNTSVQAGIIAELGGTRWKLTTGDPGCPKYKQCDQEPLPDPFTSVRLYK